MVIVFESFSYLLIQTYSMHKITHDLEQIYDSIAPKFSWTRKRHWPEFDHILEAIEHYPKKSITLIELWCGDGRLIRYLQEHTTKKLTYTWIDISQQLLDLASNHQTPKATFIKADMADFLSTVTQESTDIIISIASFQHLPNESLRLTTLHLIHRSLTYNWLHISSNRTDSDWFIKRYQTAYRRARAKRALSLWWYDKRDVYVPFTYQWNVQHRYYHLFGYDELIRLSETAWLIIETVCYIDKNGKKINDKRNARNIFMIQKKWVYNHS